MFTVVKDGITYEIVKTKILEIDTSHASSNAESLLKYMQNTTSELYDYVIETKYPPEDIDRVGIKVEETEHEDCYHQVGKTVTVQYLRKESDVTRMNNIKFRLDCFNNTIEKLKKAVLEAEKEKQDYINSVNNQKVLF